MDFTTREASDGRPEMGPSAGRMLNKSTFSLKEKCGQVWVRNEAQTGELDQTKKKDKHNGKSIAVKHFA